MRRTGSRSRTERVGSGGLQNGRRFCLPAVLAFWLVVPVHQAMALDLFTLWQRPELPLNLTVGMRADYRRQALSEGRRVDDLLRVQCLGRDDAGRWLIEVLPLVEVAPDSLVVVPGEGLQLTLGESFEQRTGGLADAVVSVRLWRDGIATSLDQQEWRRDPLVTASFSGEFAPQTVVEGASTIRVIDLRELACRQLEFVAADTQHAVLPVGEMVQVSSQEVAAAVHPDIPLLGLAYVTERVRAESTLHPPSDRFPTPPPQLRIEILECLSFGVDAIAVLDD